MSSLLLTAPAVEPLSLDEAKAYLRVETDDEDPAIGALIAGSRIHVEAQTRRALITQSWRLSFDAWPQNLRIQVVPVPLKGDRAEGRAARLGRRHRRRRRHRNEPGASVRRTSGDGRRHRRLHDLARYCRLPVLALAAAAATANPRLSAGRSKTRQRKGTPIMWNKIKARFKHSVTILWARAVAFARLRLAAGQSLLADPNVTGAIQSALRPKFIPYYVIAIGLITEIGRRRTAGKA